MTIDELKQALREVKKICKESRYCTRCPLAIGNCCPMNNSDGGTAELPEDWALDWKEEETHDPTKCRYYTPESFFGRDGGCIGTREIDPCEGWKCKRWEQKEDVET